MSVCYLGNVWAIGRVAGRLGGCHCGWCAAQLGSRSLCRPSLLVRCRIRVTKGQVLYLQVTGVAVNDYGSFTLNVNFVLPGSSLAVAQDLGSDAVVSASGDTTGYPSSYNSSCNVGSDGPDVVRFMAWFNSVSGRLSYLVIGEQASYMPSSTVGYWSLRCSTILTQPARPAISAQRLAPTSLLPLSLC